METLPIQPTTENQNTQIPETKPWYKKRWILLLILFVILFALVLLSLLKNPTPQSFLMKNSPTPTPVSLPIHGYQHLTISVSPLENSVNNSLFATISATFSRSLTLSEKAYTKIVLSPNIPGSLVWSSNNKVVTFIPDVHLESDKTYTAKLTYGLTAKIWLFSTVSQENISQEDLQKGQLQSDEQYGAWQNNLYDTYPWYDALPLQTSDYYTYFDIDTQQFISSLYVQPSDSKKISELKQQIMEKVQSLGVDTKKYGFTWNTTP